MVVDLGRLEEMEEFSKKSSLFLKETSFLVKKQHGDAIKEYLDKFIKFPGGLSVISIFFVSSDLVRNQELALIGLVLIITSLLVALNIFRVSINNDHKFYDYIVELEKPIVYFNWRLTQFSRGEVEESILLDSYEKVQEAYRKNSLNKEEVKEKGSGITFIKNSINFSFYLLIIGIVLCFLSTINFF